MALTSSTSSLLWRLFAVTCLLLLLSLAANLRQHYLNGDLSKKYFETRNYYKTAQDSIRQTRAAPPVVVYRPAPPSPAAQATLRAGLVAAVSDELREALRREFRTQNARLLTGQRVAVVTKQVLPTVAMKDTTIRRISPTTGQVVAKQAKTGTFRDPWLNLTGVVIPGQPGKEDSLQVKYYVRNDFVVRAYSKRNAKHWYLFWKPRVVYVDLKNQNPNATTTKIEAVKVEKR